MTHLTVMLYMTDVDECEERSSGCEHVCTNDIGNFTCSCYGGYELNSDNKTCDQQSKKAQLCSLLTSIVTLYTGCMYGVNCK